MKLVTIAKWPSLSSPSAATTRRAGASRPPRPRRDILDAAAAAVRARRATPRRRWRRSRPRPASRSRPSTSRSRPRAACCARSGTCCCAATTTTCRCASAAGTARCSRSPTPSASCASTRATRASSRSASAALLDVIRSAAPLDPDIAALWDAHPARVPRQPARDRRERSHAQGRARARPRRRPRHRHPLDAQPPDVWQLLVGERGWTPEQFERWFADTACDAAARLGQARRLGPRRAQPVGVQAHAVAVLDDREAGVGRRGEGAGVARP